MKCAICGLPITGNVSKDHIYPRAIWKWQENFLDPDDFEQLKTAIESSRNIVKTHHVCNKRKEDSILNVELLILTDKKRKQLHSVTEVVQPYLNGYLELKEKLSTRQNHLCYNCGNPLTNTRILRRIDPAGSRTEANGCVVCHACNYSHKNFVHITKKV